jgi:hypothetical protein
VPKRFSTSTLIDSNHCVPWLAADGPLAYTPESPPVTDYFFQYSWILPGIFDPEVNRRCHHYFGAPIRDYTVRLFEFWKQARSRQIQRSYFSLGIMAGNKVCAPVAVYRARLHPADHSDVWLLIQHGSYQWIRFAAQPYVEEGQILLYRGIGTEETFRYTDFSQELPSAPNRRTWDCYLALQWRMLSDSVLSFNTIHDRTKRCETGCLNDGTWLADQLAREAGLDIDSQGFSRTLWSTGTCSFSLEPRIAEMKFGPHFVVAKTSIDNIRLTTFFAGENEVRLVDPSRIHFLEAVGCTVGA